MNRQVDDTITVQVSDGRQCISKIVGWGERRSAIRPTGDLGRTLRGAVGIQQQDKNGVGPGRSDSQVVHPVSVEIPQRCDRSSKGSVIRYPKLNIVERGGRSEIRSTARANAHVFDESHPMIIRDGTLPLDLLRSSGSASNT